MKLCEEYVKWLLKEPLRNSLSAPRSNRGAMAYVGRRRLEIGPDSEFIEGS